ncbi:protein ALP1-like [Macadamia integrifolia]|uniref:protein ALP1-like n=1 Tax=Macadamia integrifolia TaxID=60698 RepID=UPI001C52BC1B|nr:protein ALP1-like [Macadamia integrifolia]
MGPVSGKKKRRKAKQDAFVSTPEEEEDPNDWWDKFSKRISTGTLSMSKVSDKFQSIFKISRRTFGYICSLVNEDLLANSSLGRNSKILSVYDQVAVALIRLGSGDSLTRIGDSLGLSQSTIGQITWRFVESMEVSGLKHLKWPSTEQEMTQIKTKFKRIKGFPNCCGAIDSTHIMIRLPKAETSNEIWLDSKKNHSIVLQAIVDPDMRIRDISIGWPGSMNESTILQHSGFFNLCQRGERLNGESIELSNGSQVREYIVGDVGFPLLPWLITPYHGRELSETDFEFNKHHLATMMVAQRALVRLKERWRIVQGVMHKSDQTNKLARMVFVCCILHNILIDLKDEVQDKIPSSHYHDSGYQKEFCNSVDQNGSILRDKLSLYLFGRLSP